MGTHCYRLVKIDWIDAYSEDGWEEVATIEKNKHTANCTTIGYLVKEDEGFIYVASTVSEKQAACTMAIPRGMITQQQTIGIRKYGKRKKNQDVQAIQD